MIPYFTKDGKIPRFKMFKDLGSFDKYLRNWCFENNILRKQLWETLPFCSIELLDEKSRMGICLQIIEKNGKYYLPIYDINKWLKGVRNGKIK